MNILLNLPIFKVSLFITLLCYIFITFFTSPVFQSTSILDVSTGENMTLPSTSLLDSFGGTSSEDAFQLKSYLESEEASNTFKKVANVESIFRNDQIKFFSRFRPTKSSSFHDYFLGKIEITIDPDSNSLIIATNAFKPEDALYINLELINMASDFFNRKARLSSINSKASKICELYFINSNILNIEPIELEYNSDLASSSDSANELLISKSQSYRDFCLDKVNSKNGTNESNLNLFPSFEIKSINAGASRQVLSEIYSDSIESITSSSNIEIIVEPILASNYESMSRTIYCAIVFAVSFILLISLKVMIRLRNEFEV